MANRLSNFHPMSESINRQPRSSIYIRDEGSQRHISSHRTFTENINRSINYIRQQKFTKSLDHWSKHNPILMAEEILFESRGVWMRRSDFVMSCLSFGLGLGNIWRFPYMCFRHGSGSFLLIYMILMVLLGAPLFFLDLYVSQFTSHGVAGCWNLAPGFRGIGYSMLVSSLFYSLYYNLLLGWNLFYFINSMRVEIPYINCNNPWNSVDCIQYNSIQEENNTNFLESASEQYWYRFIIKVSDINGTIINNLNLNPGSLVWFSCSCLLISWTFCCISLMRNVRMSGTRIYIMVIMAYCTIGTIMVLAILLDDSWKGIRFLFHFDMKAFKDPTTWINAAEQLCFSLGLGFGGMLNMGSYNRFHDPIDGTILKACVFNFCTSLLHTMTVYFVIGHVSTKLNIAIESLANNANDGMLFVFYPECIAAYSFPQILGIFFFLLMFIMGLDCLFVIMDTVISGLVEIFPNINQTKYHRVCFILLLHVCTGLCSIIMVTNTGFSWFKLFEFYTTSVNLLVIQLSEVIVIAYIYGINNMARDYHMMTNRRLNIFWKVCITIVAPMLLAVFIACDMYFTSRQSYVSYKEIEFPKWAVVVGYCLMALTLLPIPIWFLFFFWHKQEHRGYSYRESLERLFKPAIKWGPSKKVNWLTNSYYRERLLIIRATNDRIRYDSHSVLNPTTNSKWLRNQNILNGLQESSEDVSISTVVDVEDILEELPIDINFEYVTSGSDSNSRCSSNKSYI